jgi:hypothetical protein
MRAVNVSLSARMDRLTSQNDAIPGAVSDVGQRVARLESHGEQPGASGQNGTRVASSP